MKRWIALLLLLCLLTGCTAKPEQTAPTESVTAGTEPTQTEPSEPLTALLAHTEPAAPGSALSCVQSDTVKNLGNYRKVYMFGDCLLFSVALEESWDADGIPGPVVWGLSLVDVRTGELRASASFPCPRMPDLQVSGDRIVLSDWNSGDVTILNDRLQVERKIPGQVSMSALYLDETGRFLYTVGSEDGSWRADLSTGERTELLPEAAELYAENAYDNVMTLSYISRRDLQKHRVCMNMTTGKMLEQPFDGSYITAICRSGVWMGWTNEGAVHMGWDQDPFVETSGGSPSLIDGPAPLCITVYGEDGSWDTRIYRRDGSLYTACHCGREMGFLSGSAWCPQLRGYFLTAVDMNGVPQLLFWDPQIPAEGELVSMHRRSEIAAEQSGGAVSPMLYRKAHELSEKYGIRVRIADECDTRFGDFYAEQELDEKVIRKGLAELEEALAAYPEGFFRQLPYGDYRTVEISLTGTLTDSGVPEDANAFTDFAAFVNQYDGKHLMVVNITLDDLQQTIFHEFSHIIDAKLEFRAKYVEDALYSEERWAALNPESFTYAGSVYIMPETYGHDGYDSYFIDQYARTFPTEDRARVLEYAMTGHDESFDPKNAGPLREKLRYYAAAIRDGFDTAGWPEVTRWEKPIVESFGQKAA